MSQQNMLAQDIQSSTGAMYDAACKRLLAYKQFLARIMQSCVVEFRNCTIDDIVNKYIEGEPHVAQIGVHPNTTNAKLITGMNTEDSSINEGMVTYDIIFYALAPKDGELIKLILNVESQMDASPGYPLTKRAIYYCGRMLSAQYGREFAQSEYHKLKKVYSIWICTDAPLYKQNTINIYSVKEECFIGNHVEPLRNYDLLTVVTIYTVNKIDGLSDSVVKLLSILLSRNLEAEKRINILVNDYHIEVNQKVKQEVEHMCNLSQGVREEGRVEERRKTILKMLRKKKALSEILDFTDASKEDVYILAKENGLDVVVA
ncbi:MAG: hypothetical protein ACI3XH_01605 [Phascolarctobacterium sp.]